MPGRKEIRNKIKSIKSTQKITRAMEMVAASKMRKAQAQMQRSRPYSEKILQIINHLAHAHTEYRHPFVQSRAVKRMGIIVISSDRGLCGSLNTNLFRKSLQTMKNWQKQGLWLNLYPIGNKGLQFFRRFGGQIKAEYTHLGDNPSLNDLIGVIQVMLNEYNSGEVDRVMLVYNRFVNTMTQEPRIEQLLPLESTGDEKLTHHWDYIYEPNAKEVLEKLLTGYIESRVYQGVVENIACEQAARMVAMKSASDNAATLIDELQLVYNKARQAAITQELSEIVAGAAAV